MDNIAALFAKTRPEADEGRHFPNAESFGEVWRTGFPAAVPNPADVSKAGFESREIPASSNGANSADDLRSESCPLASRRGVSGRFAVSPCRIPAARRRTTYGFPKWRARSVHAGEGRQYGNAIREEATEGRRRPSLAVRRVFRRASANQIPSAVMIFDTFARLTGTGSMPSFGSKRQAPSSFFRSKPAT